MERMERHEILETLGGISEEIYLELVRLLIKQTEEQVERAYQALQENRYDVLAGIAHSIKGSSANLRLVDVFHAALNLEQAAKQQAGIAAIREILRVLTEAVWNLGGEFPPG